MVHVRCPHLLHSPLPLRSQVSWYSPFLLLNLLLNSRGLESALFGIAVTNGVYYYWYEMVKGIFESNSISKVGLSTGQSMMAGAIAGDRKKQS